MCHRIISHFVVEVDLLITYPEHLLITDYEEAHSFLQVKNITGFLKFHSHKILKGKLLDSIL